MGSTGAAVAGVNIDATSNADIDAFVGAVAGSISFAGTTGVGVALGIGVARNYIGVDPNANDVVADYESDQTVTSRPRARRCASYPDR